VLRSGPELHWRKLRLKLRQVNSAELVLAEVTEDLAGEVEDLEKVEDLEVAEDLEAEDLVVLEQVVLEQVVLEQVVLEQVVLEQVVLEEVNRRPIPA
jgi:hypothetical protein